MSTLGSILNIARSAITAHQTAVRVASQNITNAQTEGYSRQTVRFVDSRPDRTPWGRLGTGVRIYDIGRVRDALIDSGFRRESGRSASFELRHELLSRVEEILGEPSDTGLSAALDAYYGAWGDLANDPTSETTKRVLLQRSGHLASTLNGFSTRLDDLVQNTRGRLTTAVKQINDLTEQVAKINEVIVREEAGGFTASDLRDQRDRLLDSLSQLAAVKVTERANGTVAVVLENSLVVDGNAAKPLSAAGEPPVVKVGTATLHLSPEGSTLGEYVTALTTRFPAVQARLDELAEALVVQTNALQNAGFLPDGTPGSDFFDPTGTTARSIRLVATVDTIAASDSATEPNSNRIALAHAEMRGRADKNTIALGIWSPAEAGLLGGISASEHYRATVAELAVDTSLASDSATVFGTLAEQLEIRRQSVSGVSTDEELIRVMQHQQAYTAAARLVNVVDEMVQTVLDLKR